MKTGTHGDGLAIYGPRPSVEDMQKRAKREGFPIENARPCVVTNRRYWTEAWAVESAQTPGEFYLYTYRRDGKVGISWVPIAADRLEFEVKP